MEATDNQFKRCPFCAEEIRREATVCKHCGKSLNGTPSPSQALLRPNALLSFGLILSLFMPWAYFLGFGISGYQLSKIGSAGNAIWILPLIGAANIIVDLLSGDSELIETVSFLSGIVPLIALFYALFSGQELLQAFGIGAYFTAAIAVGFIVYAIYLGIIRKRTQSA